MAEFRPEIGEWQRYKFLLEGTTDMIFFFSGTGVVEECNSSAFEQLGFTHEDTIFLQDIFPSCVKMYDDRLIFQDGMLEQCFETSIYRKNKTCFPVELRLEMLDAAGQYGVCRAVSTVDKVEAKRRVAAASERVEEVNKERNELVANVTHELRTPVNGVMGLAQNLLDTDLTPSQRETVELIDSCCKNMIKIINNILDYSKLQANKFTIEYRQFSFNKMMNQVIRTTQPTVEEKGLRLVCNVSEGIPDQVIGDELRITQVLNNLLSNAIKFTSVGQITVSAVVSMEFEDEIELFFMVIDSGIGISDQEKEKLFKSFSQVDASITRKYGGTGLGLSITKSLVEMMGGTINVESEKGKGSTFSFSVRLKKVKEEEGAPEEQIPAEELSFHVGEAEDAVQDTQEIFKLGSAENLKDLTVNMEKLVLCIEMGNWERANNFAESIKQLVADDTDLKRKAFRLQMTLRREDHEKSIEEYQVLDEAIQDWKEEAAK